MRVARSRRLVAEGYALGDGGARPADQPAGALPDAEAAAPSRSGGPPADPVEHAIVEEAIANQTDGYRMVTAFVRRRLGRPVNRKRVLRVMRERKLIQRRRPLERRKRPGFFRVERPRQLWQLDMTSIWVAEHGWTLPDGDHRLLHPRDRRLAARAALPRRRSDRSSSSAHAAAYAIEPGELVLGSDNGSAFTARRFREKLSELGIRHRRGGYRDPESQAFIESWFGKLKEREVWLNEYETLDDARRGIGGYVDRYHHRPHSGLNYRTPARGAPDLGGSTGLQKTSGLNLSTPAGSTSRGCIPLPGYYGEKQELGDVGELCGGERRVAALPCQPGEGSGNTPAANRLGKRGPGSTPGPLCCCSGAGLAERRQ